jgi:hypothetical protein
VGVTDVDKIEVAEKFVEQVPAVDIDEQGLLEPQSRWVLYL